MVSSFTSVTRCDTCGGALAVEPGRGLVCANDCPTTSDPGASATRRVAPEREPRRIIPAAPSASTSSPWEVFDVRWTKQGGSAVRLGKNGQLVIGSALAAALGDTERVELRYDRAGQRLGLARTSGEHGARISRSAKGQQSRLSLAGLFRHYGLTLPAKNVAIAATVDGGVLVVPLKGLGGGS